MKVICRTNLDLEHEHWPTELPAVPHVGNLIQSTTNWGGFHLRLEVKRVVWREIETGYTPETRRKEWVPEIEMGIPPFIGDTSIRGFYEWYAPKVGRSVAAFV